MKKTVLATLLTSSVWAVGANGAEHGVVGNGIANREHGHEHRVISALKQPRQLSQADIEQLHKTRDTATQQKAACTLQAFATSSGDALVTLVKASEIGGCLNDLYSLTGDAAKNTFAESKMVTIADAIKAQAAAYPGDNSTQMLNLVTFLRAGYYVQYYNESTVGSYGAALQTAIRGALDGFFASARAFDVTQANGSVLSEIITTVDSSEENARYASKLAEFLNSVNTSTLATSGMRNAVNSVFTVAFRGHQNDDFKALMPTDSRFFDALYNFHTRLGSSLIGTNNEYLTLNAARESARFLRYDGALKETARTRTKAMIEAAPPSGNTLALWAALADMADYYDGSNCSFYNTCNWEEKLADNVLSVEHTCSSTIKIRAQAMDANQLSDTCSKLTVQESYFHQKLETNNIPIPGDKNANLEIVVFNSSDDYENYAGTLFGIDTNNGGMYLEGNPDRDGNQARFIAYERTWRLPGESTLPFAIWNLEHEYVHYLDGRFIAKGGFSDSQRAKTTWWGEGLAQYVALKDNYPDAMELAGQSNPVALSTIFQNDYNSGSERVYKWGYLGVRFMFERHHPDVRTIIGHFRNGAYTTDYTTFMNGLNSRYDAEFKTWLGTLASGGSNGAPSVNAGSDQTVAGGAAVTLNATASDPNGDSISYAWRQTAGTTVTLQNGNTSSARFTAPSVSAETELEFELTVTDSKGLSSSDRIKVRVQKSGSGNAPRPNAGADQNVAMGAWVTLSGNATDAEGGTLNYAWMQVSGPSVTLENPAMASTRFVAPNAAADVELVFELKVTDSTGLSATDRVSVRAQKTAGGSAPIVNAGADQSVAIGSTVWLRGSATDADSSALTYSWSQTSGPSVTLSRSDAAEVSFVAPSVTADTVIEFALTVTDSSNLSNQDQVRITVQPSANTGGGDSDGGDEDDGGSGGGSTGLLMLAVLAGMGYRQRSRHQ